MRNHSPFLLQTIKQNKMDIKTYIPNQQKSSFTIYRKFIVDMVNEMIENKNKSICSTVFQKTYVDNKQNYIYAPEDVIYFIREDLLGKYPEENKRA